MIVHNIKTFHGISVEDFKSSGDIQDLANTAPRVRCDYDDEEMLTDYLDRLLAEPGSGSIRALVLGLWIQDGEPVDATPREAIEFLVSNKSKLPKLEALFVGDIIGEENEISWINQCDMSPLWSAFPLLQSFGARGSQGLRLGKIRHEKLTRLVVETGGMPAAVAREALDASAPLSHLELWLGVDDYGLTTGMNDLEPLFAGALFPGLDTLGLRNCLFADEIAVRLATSPVLERISHLDLSLGTLRDEGAEALIASNKLGHLKSLDIHHHFVSDEVVARLSAATPNLIADDKQNSDNWDGEDYYYVSVSE